MEKLTQEVEARRIAERHPKIGTLFMSGYSDEMLGHRGALEPGAMLLQKPFARADLLEKVRKALVGRTGSA